MEYGVKKNTDNDLYDAESRMSLIDALTACGESMSALTGLRREKTLRDSRGDAIVSYWPTTDGGIDARCHRREQCDDMDGSITCENGEASLRAYYSRLRAR